MEIKIETLPYKLKFPAELVKVRFDTLMSAKDWEALAQLISRPDCSKKLKNKFFELNNITANKAYFSSLNEQDGLAFLRDNKSVGLFKYAITEKGYHNSEVKKLLQEYLLEADYIGLRRLAVTCLSAEDWSSDAWLAVASDMRVFTTGTDLEVDSACSALADGSRNQWKSYVSTKGLSFFSTVVEKGTSNGSYYSAPRYLSTAVQKCLLAVCDLKGDVPAADVEEFFKYLRNSAASGYRSPAIVLADTKTAAGICVAALKKLYSSNLKTVAAITSYCNWYIRSQIDLSGTLPEAATILYGNPAQMEEDYEEQFVYEPSSIIAELPASEVDCLLKSLLVYPPEESSCIGDVLETLVERDDFLDIAAESSVLEEYIVAVYNTEDYFTFQEAVSALNILFENQDRYHGTLLQLLRSAEDPSSWLDQFGTLSLTNPEWFAENVLPELDKNRADVDWNNVYRNLGFKKSVDYLSVEQLLGMLDSARHYGYSFRSPLLNDADALEWFSKLMAKLVEEDMWDTALAIWQGLDPSTSIRTALSIVAKI